MRSIIGKISSLLIVLSMMLPSATAQENVLNTFSSYSMYGLGILETQGTLASRSMGGAGVATRSRTSINLLNPASYSLAIQKGVLMEFGLEGAAYNSSQKIDGEMSNSSFVTGNFHDIALQVPIAKGLGFGLSLSPYSSAGYQIEKAFMSDTYDYVQYLYEGSGVITQVKLGVGWEIVKGLSVGIAGQYYWGTLDREFTAAVTNIITPGDAISPAGVDNLSVSKIKGQVGLQYSPMMKDEYTSLTIGATLDLGGDLTPRYARVVTGLDRYEDLYAQSDTTTISIVLPRQLSLGVTYNSEKLMVALDYTYQNWTNSNATVENSYSGIDVAYHDVNQLRLGIGYTPNRRDVRKYMNRVTYRVGARYGGYQYTFAGVEIGQYAATAGAGFPINFIGISNIDFGFEWGCLGSTIDIIANGVATSLVKQNYFKFALGITLFGDDYWFRRYQID